MSDRSPRINIELMAKLTGESRPDFTEEQAMAVARICNLMDCDKRELPCSDSAFDIIADLATLPTQPGITIEDAEGMGFHVWIDCPHCEGDACKACEGDGGGLVKVISIDQFISRL